MTVREILHGWLVEHGYDCLVRTDLECGECGCPLDDLLPCEACPARCVPGNTCTQSDTNSRCLNCSLYPSKRNFCSVPLAERTPATAGEEEQIVS